MVVSRWAPGGDRFGRLHRGIVAKMYDVGSLIALELSAPTALASRDAPCNTQPPPFLEKISCLAVITGETCRSGCNPGLDGWAKRREIFNDSRTIRGKSREPLSDSILGLKTGEFREEHE
jgi:hypothetical protein